MSKSFQSIHRGPSDFDMGEYIGSLRCEALRLAAVERYFVLPVYGILGDGNCACGRACGAAGKHPHGLVRHGVRGASREAQAIRWWLKREPAINLAVATGPSSVVVLDVDPRNGGSEALSDLVSHVGPLPDTRTTLTGGGGQHYWFTVEPIAWRWDDSDSYRLEDSPEVPGGKMGPGLDIQAAGRYVVVPPSRHASGSHYRWLDPAAPAVPAPEWLLTGLRHAARSTFRRPSNEERLCIRGP